MVNGVEDLQYYLFVACIQNGQFLCPLLARGAPKERCHFEYWQEPCKKDIVFWISK
jgi:hypothetical protein